MPEEASQLLDEFYFYMLTFASYRNTVFSGDDDTSVALSTIIELFSNMDVSWETIGLDKYTNMQRLLRLQLANGPGFTASFNPIWLTLSAEPSDYEMEVARLRLAFAVGEGGKLPRSQIETRIEEETVDLAVLQIHPDVLRNFVAAAPEPNEESWDFEEFLSAAVDASLEHMQVLETVAAGGSPPPRIAQDEQDSPYGTGRSAEADRPRDRIEEVSVWSAADVAHWIEHEVGLPQYRVCFEAHNFHGGRLLSMTMDTLPRLSIRQFGDQKRIMEAVRRLKGLPEGRLETLRDIKLNMGRFEPPPKLHMTMATVRYGRNVDFREEKRMIDEAHATPLNIPVSVGDY